jgi:hypothetical protein
MQKVMLVKLFLCQVYPLEVIRRRMQQTAAAATATNRVCSQATRSAASSTGLCAFRSAAQEIWRKEGLAGFYSGIVPNTIQASAMPCVQNRCKFKSRLLMSCLGAMSPAEHSLTTFSSL